MSVARGRDGQMYITNVVYLGHRPSAWYIIDNPDIKVHEANMGPIWGRQDPGGPHVGPMNLAIWVGI